MRKSNWTYVLYQTFASDLLFWIVIDNLYLSTIKGLSAFEIILITILGMAFSLIFYPLTNLIVRKTNSKTSIIIGSVCFCIAIILFIFCNTIYGFVIAQFLYNLSAPFRMVSNVMLKNNLKQNNKQDQFVKWQSYGKLGYSIITLVISLLAGFLFNVYAYLPLILAFVGAVIGLVFAIIYQDSPPINEQDQTPNVKISSLLKNKTMIYIMFINIFAVGAYIFLQTRSTMLIQYICEGASIDVEKISLIISGIVFGSRLMRVLSNLIFPKLYNKIKRKPAIILTVSALILLSNICFAIGANINANYILKLIIITIGFYIILSVRDIYSVCESKIIVLNMKENEQKQAFVMASIFEKLGRLISNGFALVVLGFLPLNLLCICMLGFTICQIFICIPFAKYFKKWE